MSPLTRKRAAAIEGHGLSPLIHASCSPSFQNPSSCEPSPFLTDSLHPGHGHVRFPPGCSKSSQSQFLERSMKVGTRTLVPTEARSHLRPARGRGRATGARGQACELAYEIRRSILSPPVIPRARGECTGNPVGGLDVVDQGEIQALRRGIGSRPRRAPRRGAGRPPTTRRRLSSSEGDAIVSTLEQSVLAAPRRRRGRRTARHEPEHAPQPHTQARDPPPGQPPKRRGGRAEDLARPRRKKEKPRNES